jgi:hypothetical protein
LSAVKSPHSLADVEDRGTSTDSADLRRCLGAGVASADFADSRRFGGKAEVEVKVEVEEEDLESSVIGVIGG